MRGKAKANNPLLAAVAGLVFLVVVGSGVCWRLEFLCANGDVAKSRPPLSVGKKARPMGARLQKSRPTPCSSRVRTNNPLLRRLAPPPRPPPPPTRRDHFSVES